MSLRKTLLLTLVLAALGAYLFLVDIPRGEQQAQADTLVDLSVADMRALSITRGDDRLELQRGDDDEWTLTAPLQAKADTAIVNNLLSAIADCKVARTLPSPESLEGFGLDAPFIRIGITGTAGEPTYVDVGNTAPVGDTVYLRRGDDTAVLLVEAAFRTSVDKGVDDFRDKRVFDFADSDVRWIEIQKGERQVRVERNDGDTWQIVSGATYPGDATAVQTYLSSLRSLRVANFTDEAPSDVESLGLTTPRLSIRIATGEEREQAIVLGSTAPSTEIHAQIAGQTNVFTIHDWAYRNLDKSARDLRDKQLFDFDPESVHALVVVRGDGETFRLQRGETDWSVVGVDGAANQIEIAQYVRDMAELVGYEIVADDPEDLARFGLDAPLLQLTAYGADEAPLASLMVAKKVGSDGIHSFYAKSDQRPMVMLVRSYLFNRLDKKAAALIESGEPTADVAD